MYRLFALVWNPARDMDIPVVGELTKRLLMVSTEWRCVFDHKGLRVFQANMDRGAKRGYPLTRDRGIVLGKLFHRLSDDGETRCAVMLDDRPSQAIVDTKGAFLVDHYWGHYLAFVQDKSAGKTYVFRDPTGGVPCFYTRADGIHLFMSDLEDSIALGVTDYSVNQGHIAAFFWNMRLITRETGFEKIFQLRAGECIAINPNGTTRAFLWEPSRVYASGATEDHEQAKTELRKTVTACVNAWASCYDSIVHELSGGLDSSIVAVCLQRAYGQPNVVFLNLSTDTRDGDEQRFAQLVAHQGATELVEGRWSHGRSLESMLDAGKNATPTMNILLSESAALKAQLVEKRRAGAIFSGQGGDHLFHYRKTALVAAEYIHTHSFGPALPRILSDTCLLTNSPYVSVLKDAVKYGLIRLHFDVYKEYRRPTLLSTDLLEGLGPNTLLHPWIERAAELPRSKVQQIADLIDTQNFYLTPCRYADVVHPIISQPVIECCLRIPTYVLTYNGVNRALVREAFANCLPSAIVGRTTKGGTTSYFNRLVVQNAGFLRDYLLSGLLCQQRFVDKAKLERQLSESQLIKGERLVELLTAVRAESWLRSWSDLLQKSAATRLIA